MEWLKGKKTYIIAGLMVLVSLVQFLTGDLGFVEFITNEQVLFLLNGLGLGALRSGVSKNK